MRVIAWLGFRLVGQAVIADGFPFGLQLGDLAFNRAKSLLTINSRGC
jgi:hypothetical protein